MPDIKYEHAYIEDNNVIISINDLTKDNCKQYSYRCIGCGHELLPRAIGSKYRRPHFYHTEAVTCSGETYLHKLAKRIIVEKFYSQPSFIIEYPVTKECKKIGCIYKNPRCRKESTLYQVDLKKYYDTCTEESAINGFVADILLTNSKNPNVEPVLIEICVSHPCDENKRNSGFKIIEIKIKGEQDVYGLNNETILCEPLYASTKERKVEFISFKRNISNNDPIKLQRYVYIPNQNPMGYMTEIDCNKAQNRIRTDSEIELNLLSKSYIDCHIVDAILWMTVHKGWRRCNLCKFYYATKYEDSAICRLSKKYGKPAHPKMNEAEECRSYCFNISNPSFILDRMIVEDISFSPPPLRPEYKVILAVSRSFDNYELFKEKILYYLSEKMQTHSLVILTGASQLTDMFTSKLSEEIDFLEEPHKADWDKYGQSAIRISNDEMTSTADALIAFWDGRSAGIENLIELAKQKNIKTAVVKY